MIPSGIGGALEGVRILDMATVLAGPVGATLCADHGAHVVKLELPGGGDALRSLQPMKDGEPLWWKVANRGKLGITLDVRKPRGRSLLLSLLPSFDVLVENFRTGTMDNWGLDVNTLRQANPRLIIVRLTGFGQTGPYKDRPGFARIFEAMSGFTNLNGPEGGPPLHSNYPVGDYIAGLFCAFSIAMEVARLRNNPTMSGTEVDLSATEALFRLLDPLPVEFEQLGYVRGPAGNRASYTAPSNMYVSADGAYFSLVGTSNAIFSRLCAVIGRPEWREDERFRTNPARIEHIDELDEAIAEFFRQSTFDVISNSLVEAGIPFSKVYSVKEIVEDAHFKARDAIIRLADPDYGSIPGPCIVPRVVGRTALPPRTGPSSGQNNLEVYSQLGLSAEDLAKLREDGVI